MAGSSPPAAIQLHQLQELLLSLPAPDPTLFADVSEAPCSAPLDAAAAAAATTAAARHVRSLTALVEQLSALQLGLEALLAAAAEVDDPLAPPRSGGGARFVELPSDAPPSDLVAQLVLAAALYGPDPRLDRPWAVLPAAEAAQGLLLALAAKLEPEAPGEATAEAAAHQQQQQLLALAAPLAAQRLRPVLGALAEHGRRPATRLEPFTGECVWGVPCLPASTISCKAHKLATRCRPPPAAHRPLLLQGPAVLSAAWRRGSWPGWSASWVPGRRQGLKGAAAAPIRGARWPPPRRRCCPW